MEEDDESLPKHLPLNYSDIHNLSALFLSNHYGISNSSTFRWNSSTLLSLRSHEAVSKNIQYVLITLYSLAAFLSFLGNMTVIIVLTFGKRTVIRGYLISLAVSDVAMATFCIPFSYTNFMFNYWIFLPEFCRIVMFMQHLSVMSSVYTLVAIGLDRYKALTQPFDDHWIKKKIYVIPGIWIISILGSLAQLFVSYSVEYTRFGNKFHVCQENWPRTEDDFYEKSYTIFVFLLTFAIPIFGLGYTYLNIATMMFTYRRPGNADVNRDNQRNHDKVKVIKMMVIVMACFVVCWFPLHILNIVIYFAPSVVMCGGKNGCFLYYMSFYACHWIAMSNSFMNPIIYCFMSKNFRDDLQSILEKCGLKRKQGIPQIQYRSDLGSFGAALHVSTRNSIRSSTRSTNIGRLSGREPNGSIELKPFKKKSVDQL